jgi:predicted transcriptional regulator
MMRRCENALMRTTVDLPEDLHRIAKAIARDRGITFSEAITYLLRRALGERQPAEVSESEQTGLAVIQLGHVITSEDVREADDD